jgi:HAE1 family hydrophobic/amphiphilic exporter-1
MRLADASINRPVTTAMVAIGLLVFGLVGVTRMPVDIYPDVTLPMVVIATFYPGAGPLEVESEVTGPIEQRVGTIPNIRKLTSRSGENVSVVQLEMEWGSSLDGASADIRDRLDMVASLLPDDVTRPFIFKFDPSMMPVVQIGLFGDLSEAELYDVGQNLADGLQRIGGVAAASVAGGARRQARVEIDPARLAASGISLDQLTGSLRAQNLNYPIGDVSVLDRRFIIRLMGEYADLEDLRNTVVGAKGNAPVLLKQIAEVTWQPEEKEAIARYNGQNCVFVVVQRRPDANTVQVATAVRREFDRLRAQLPSGTDARVFFDSSDEIKRSISNVTSNILIGGILAVLILFLFLRRFRATMFVAFSIPVSIFFAVLFMYVFGFTINILSMAGLAIAVGMVVDNGIVVFESIFRRREFGDKPEAAASVGTSQVAMAITASTLTTVVVFLPMLLVRGLLQIFFRELVWAVVGSLMASLGVALTLIPMLSSRYLKMPAPGTREVGLRAWAERLYVGIEDGYSRMIGWAVGHRRLVVGITVALFAGTLTLVPMLKSEFMPAGESWFHQLTAEMPVGTNLATTDAAVRRLEAFVRDSLAGDVEGLAAQVGAGANIYAAIFGAAGPNSASISMLLRPKEKREHSVPELDAALRREAGRIPGLSVRTDERSFTSMAGMGTAAVQVDITGHDLALADTLTRQVIAAIETIPGLVDLKSSREPGSPEVRLVVDRQKASLYGLTPYQIGSALRTQVQGTAATTFRRAGDEYDVLVRLPHSERASMTDILGLVVTGPLGPVPLRSLVRVERGTSPKQVEHKNTERIVQITGKAEGTSSGQLAQRVGRAIGGIVVPAGFDVRLSGSYEDMMRTFQDLGLIVVIALLLVFMVMASQFESFRDPFIIMFTVPFAAIGAIWMLFITGTAISVTSGLGILVLVGVVVNNGIVYIDYVNQLRRNQGMALVDAVKEGGRVRLRPILMTSLTTIFGLIPLALEIGQGAEMWAPLGRAIIGGMLVSTFLPLIFIPVLYVIFENRAERRRLKLAARETARSEEVPGQ